MMLTAALGMGCVAHAPLPDQYRGPRELPIAMIDEFGSVASDAPVIAPIAEMHDARRRPSFTLRRVSLASNAEPGTTIDFDYYDTNGDDTTPVILVLPIFNGNPIVTRYFARYFASQGWAAVALGRTRDPLDYITEPDEAIHDNLVDYRRVLDWIGEQPELDADRIGAFGISFGAFDGVMLTALDERIDALVAAMAGGDLAYLAMHTSYRPVSRTVEEMLADTGLTREALYDVLQRRVGADALTLGPYVDAERVLMVMTRNDTIMPFEAQQALHASMGTPEALYLPTGHRTSIVFFPKLRSSAYEFFGREFADGPATRAHPCARPSTEQCADAVGERERGG
jgi:X-Pro dipeptidyl-peptidase (S15 family)